MRQRDPIARVEAYLRSIDEFDDEFATTVAHDADELGAAVRAACLTMTSAEPLSILDGVYAEPHTGLDEERTEFAAYLDGFEAAAEGQEAGR